MLIDSNITTNKELAAHTGCQFLTDPAVIASLTTPDDTPPVLPLPPMRAHSVIRMDRIQLTPRLVIEVPTRYIVSGRPVQLTPTGDQS